MEAHLTECVHEALSAYLHRNAVFLAERLHASFPTEVNAHLLATCYLRSKQPYRAYAVLRGAEAASCRYLLAVACLELSLLTEAEQALSGLDESEVPGGAAGHYLLGLVCRKTNRCERAVAHFRAALTADPFCWSAYEELCALGDDKEAAALLNNASPEALYPPAGAVATAPDGLGFVTPDGTQDAHTAAAVGTPAATPAAQLSGGTSHWAARPSFLQTPCAVDMLSPGAQTPADSDSVTPAPNMGSFVTPSPGGAAGTTGPPPPPAAVKGGARGAAARSAAAAATMPSAASAPGDKCRTATPNASQRRKFVDEGKLRKVSGRLFSDVAAQSLRRSLRLSGLPSAPVEMTPTPGQRGVGTEQGRFADLRVAADAQQLSDAVRTWDVTSTKTAEGGREALVLLRVLGEGHRMLSMYRCKEALVAFARLPPAQYRTGWVLCQVGRAHAEAVDYAAAERAFAAARQACPHQLEGMEHYSTVLWHLKRDAALAHLAHEAVALDRLSPTAWCVMGNCLSAQRDHEAALRAFNRAIALDRDFTYAYTLAGHEHFAGEDWDAAVADYRVALGVDMRHYNAWYGLGAVLMRQEKYELAEYHFRRALEIHPRSSVLHCCQGQALHALGRAPDALAALDAAVAADARNPLARYERAAVLVSMDRLQEALTELGALKEVAPREASVYVLMGKVYRRLNQPGFAALCAGTGADMGGATELGGKEEAEEAEPL